jgi:urea carboxylase
LGVRLNGPRPTWTRTDGGEGGSHPSNVHDHTYAIGSINYTGDMPVILMVDGPSLGGFVCPATIVSTELWKIGQVRAGRVVQL